MLAVFNNLFTVYDNLKNKIYNYKNIEIPNIKVYNFIPIIYNKKKFLLTSLEGLENLFLDKNNKILLKYFIDDKTNGEIILNKHLNLLNIKNFNIDYINEFDSFYDEHTRLLFIKFQDICIEYIDISNFYLPRLLNTSFKDEKIIISFIDNDIKKINIDTKISSDYIYIDKYFTLPPLPYLTINNYPNISVYKGSMINNYNNDFIGIINCIYNENLLITPLLSIIRSLKYLEGYTNSLKIINFDFEVENINKL
jgi:hypothetical protein